MKNVNSPLTGFIARTILLQAILILITAANLKALDGPDPIFRKPDPITMSQLDREKTKGVSVLEVCDYAPGLYSGSLTPSPPHADLNPKKAFVVFWKDHSHRLVFSHEASYCPILELTNGAGMCSQFFESNLEGERGHFTGSAELFNNKGRKERNSFVDVIHAGPLRVWVRWTYFAVHKDDDTQPRLRATEDYLAYPNGLILRRLTYESLMPDSYFAYSQQPVELFGVAPVGKLIKDLFPYDPEQKGCLTLVALDIYSDKSYEIFWGDGNTVSRRGDNSTLAAIANSPGRALVMPFRDKMCFMIFGNASGFPAERSDLIDHCTPGVTSGGQWKQGLWIHWPIGWLNSQTTNWQPNSPYSYSFGSIGQFFIPKGKRYTSFITDLSANVKDMDLNHWTSQSVFYVLLGTADSWDDIRRIGRTWLDRGPACANPDSIADLK